MKEKYEKPEILSENFVIEMLKAGCDCLERNVENDPSYQVWGPEWGCDCKCSEPSYYS